MYIKQIIIQGFKSYRDQTVIEPFDPRHNVVVGRNGSGKSNFFYAIQFVLSDEFSHLRPDQRQALLHESTGPRVISAYVEIIFDNSDGRLPIDKEEVYLCRVIGSKKDQYFLNKKVVSKMDVMNLLESAGFSRSNPYCIVKQGKINQMATAPDSQRLKLLREVAGTRVYDERREESNALLKECESKHEKIEEFLRTIENRLSALEGEKEELREYQRLDKMRRSLEYAIHDHELKENRKKWEEMDKLRNNSSEEQAMLNAQLQNAEEKGEAAAKQLEDVKSKVGAAKEERDAYNAENQQLLKDRTRLELNIRDLSDEVRGDNKSKERAEEELEKLRFVIGQKEAELEEILPKYEEKKHQEEEFTRDLGMKEQKRKELYAKQGRGSHFTSIEQRDQWIQKELKSLSKQIKDKKEQIDGLADDLASDGEKKIQLEMRIQNSEVTATETYQIILKYMGLETAGKIQHGKQLDRRSELWRKENHLQQRLTSLKEELDRVDRSLCSMVGKPILNGRDSVRKVLDTFRERGGKWNDWVSAYRGPVIELFNCVESIYTAVEVTAGSRLFNHVVDSDNVATQILKEMNKQQLPGEVTFMPINRLAVRDTVYPQSNDALPMVTKLKYEKRYDKVMKYIFGRTLICRDLKAATQLAKGHRLDCVTMDGDQVMSKGSMTGGYINTSRSRLQIQKMHSQYMQKIAESEDEFHILKDQLKATETEINKIISEMQRTETKNSKAKDVLDKVKDDTRLMKEELNGIDRSRQPKERSLNTLRANLDAMESTRAGLHAELNQDLMTTLCVEDQNKVDQLNDEIRILTRQNKEAFSQRMKLEAEKNKLESLLTSNLKRRKDELMQALQEIGVEGRKRQLEYSKAELQRSETKIAEVSNNLKVAEKKVVTLQRQQKEAQKKVESWGTEEKEVQGSIDEDAKNLEQITSRLSVLQKKLQECTKKIRDIGPLPSDAFDKYKNVSSNELFKTLKQCNSELEKYSHVNKKALDQFVHYSEYKEKLMQRLEQQNKGYDKIMELMSLLEQRKFEAIQFTFKQVSKNFTEMFTKLVPQGHAHLVMRTDQDEDDEHERPHITSVESFTGVGIKVSFSGKTVEMREMNQLSGGQKSLVALALIFAIQKCDPAPFYLFDEIDQALDATHRKAVADVINELSADAQFITTTFRPELLQHANKFYGVKFRNKVSHVVCVTREEAYDFVEDDATHS